MSYAKLAAFVIALGLGIGISELTNWLANPTITEPVTVKPAKIERPEAIPEPVQKAHLQESGCVNGSGAGSGDGIATGSGSGYGSGSGTSTLWSDSPPPASPQVISPLKILYKKKARYTEEAQTNDVEGTVTLRVTFLASGDIGAITKIRCLPYGLTEEAIAAAREIKFEPEKVNGIPKTTTRPVSFTFNIY